MYTLTVSCILAPLSVADRWPLINFCFYFFWRSSGVIVGAPLPREIMPKPIIIVRPIITVCAKSEKVEGAELKNQKEVTLLW